MSNMTKYSVPTDYESATSDVRWKQAMETEINALQLNQTWTLVDLPKGKKIVGCKWVYTIKLRPDTSLDWFKARLVAKGYSQTYGMDYTDTFSPVTKFNSVRILVSLAVHFDWPLHQFDDMVILGNDNFGIQKTKT